MKSRLCLTLICIVVVVCFQIFAQASIVFEGFYKINQFKNHIGFVIIKHEVDPKTKNYTIKTYLRLAKKNFDLTETLKTVSDEKMKPVEYSYSALDKNKSKTIEAQKKIDAKTKKEILSILAIEDGKKLKFDVELNKDVFFSSALFPVMLATDSGIKTNFEFKFPAIAEETAQVFEGTTKIAAKRITKDAFQLLKAENSFAGSDYEVLLTDKGEIFSTNDNKTGITTELVRNKEEAIQDIKISNKTLEQIFGSMPEGKTNSLNVK